MIYNLTPHPVMVGENTFLPTGQLARCEETWEAEKEVNGVNFLVNFRYGKTNLPEFQEGIYYIVSLPVALAEPSRKDLVISVGQIRDSEGKIIGAKGLASIQNKQG